MTNTQENGMQVSGEVQEEVELTELLPVEQSRIAKDFKDLEGTDGLKALRSFAGSEFEGFKVFRKGKGSDKSEGLEIGDQEGKKNYNLRKKRKLDYLKDEVYYYQQDSEEESDDSSNQNVSNNVIKDMANNFSGKGEKRKKVKAEVAKKKEKILENNNESEASKSEDKSEKKYCCLMCDAKFKGSGGLRNHWKVVHADGPFYKCDDCGKEFPLKERLKLHVRTHTGFKPYKCSECDKSFARGGQLAQHRRTHSHAKPYHCSLCSGTFTCAANLALHMKRHNGQKDHKCDICGRGFIRRDALKKHLECLHKDVKSFLCVICNKTFKGHLPQHMRTHCQERPHGCATCGQRFAQKSQLTVHQRTHSGQRPFRCLVCWQAFAHSTALKLHTRRHTGERPFKCTECNVGFTQLPHWKKHMKCIHKRLEPYSCKNCNSFFRIKNDLESHEKMCLAEEDLEPAADDNQRFRLMSIEKMRLLLAVLLKRISKPEKLDELGFGKRLIDEVLQDSLVSAGRDPVGGDLTELEALRKNIETFLEWTVPREHWENFKKLNKTPEEILETLTAT
ncbi:GSCOCG00002757001-RA-CDS [Cotesia congregata]|uniref:Similar to ZNF470: Zinc finger protein 470 (Homo sapiens) n=1 Tax=Cotesia congregata TaxID=51543 RepID=A0A8J2HG53_COTCN|nr:GSCOCG00002757001-RA-CDS [Cotesia congregata]CAG5097719.1 Similar to ZNF470: Zinc finger protein 470 (Homo sapiens) [Cotesia congregata]